MALKRTDNVVARLLAHGAERVGEVVQYEDTYRLACVRGPEGHCRACRAARLRRGWRITGVAANPAIASRLQPKR